MDRYFRGMILLAVTLFLAGLVIALYKFGVLPPPSTPPAPNGISENASGLYQSHIVTDGDMLTNPGGLTRACLWLEDGTLFTQHVIGV